MTVKMIAYKQIVKTHREASLATMKFELTQKIDRCTLRGEKFGKSKKIFTVQVMQGENLINAYKLSYLKLLSQ